LAAGVAIGQIPRFTERICSFQDYTSFCGAKLAFSGLSLYV